MEVSSNGRTRTSPRHGAADAGPNPRGTAADAVELVERVALAGDADDLARAIDEGRAALAVELAAFDRGAWAL